jgi:hypothetical protein
VTGRAGARWLTIVVCLAAAGEDGLAQGVPRVVPAPPDAPGLFTHAQFHMVVDLLVPTAEPFVWNAEAGGEFDVVDVGRARLNLLAHYQAVLGRELQPFDPVQGNYRLQALGALRLGGRRGELGLYLNHVSRHLGDRPKEFGIAWNTLGLQYGWRGGRGNWHVEAVGRGAWVVLRNFVDYRATLEADLFATRPVAPLVDLFVRGAAGHTFVRPGVERRDSLLGYRAETGVRVAGRRASADLYLGVEQRGDADALTRESRRWLVVGLRILSAGRE